jgi:hypothetical protein
VSFWDQGQKAWIPWTLAQQGQQKVAPLSNFDKLLRSSVAFLGELF